MKRFSLGVLVLFLLVAPGLVAPLLAQQLVPDCLVPPPGLPPPGCIVPPPGCLPEGPVHLDCLEYDNGGKCIHAKEWSECWNPATNEIHRDALHIIAPAPGDESYCSSGLWHRWGLRTYCK
jgi:hypothetical protein